MGSRSEYGEQKGQLPPRTKIIFSLLVVFALTLPQASLAAEFTYLKNNLPDFIDKSMESYGEMINIAALLHDYDEKLILSVIIVESEGNKLAVSHKGAQGLMQLMPGTAKAMGALNPKEPFQNILAGTKYLKELEQRYGFKNHKSALVAYNMGPTRAKRWLSQYEAADYGYVRKVMYVYKYLEREELAQKEAAMKITLELNKGKTDNLITEEQVLNAVHILTKPRSLSVSAYPMTLSARRQVLINQN